MENNNIKWSKLFVYHKNSFFNSNQTSSAFLIKILYTLIYKINFIIIIIIIINILFFIFTNVKLFNLYPN